MSNKPFEGKIVFSTNRDLDLSEKQEAIETPTPSQQTLYISLERNKGGKIATIVEKFVGSEEDLQSLGKLLKNKCGVGGTVKDGIILIQGEKRDRIIEILMDLGYKVKKKGG